MNFFFVVLWIKQKRSGSSSGNNRPHLYPNNNGKSNRENYNLDRRELLEKYQNRKKAENEFKLIKSNIQYIDNIIAKNPNLQSYYSMWMFQAKQALKECISVIEAPDNVSFSVYLYINTLWRILPRSGTIYRLHDYNEKYLKSTTQNYPENFFTKRKKLL